MKHFYLLVCLFIINLLFAFPGNAFSGSGTGLDVANPFIITSCAQLQEMNDDLDAFYALANNIDCAATKTDAATWGANGFDPIGNTSDALAFTGQFDGGNFIISNLYINRDTTDDAANNAGLFGRTLNATLKNINLTNFEIIASHMAGGLVGLMYGGSVTNCDVTGTIAPQLIATHASTWSEIGGLIGSSRTGASITTSSSDVALNFNEEVINEVTMLGGFIGSMDSTDVSGSSSSGSITIGTTTTLVESVGGFIGDSYNSSTVTSSSTTSSISIGNGITISGIGGFAGYTGATNVSRSSSSGSITIGTTTTLVESVGGFIGDSYNSSTVTSSSSTGSVSVGDGANINSIGGFIGYLTSTVSNSFTRSSLTIGTTTSLDSVGGFAGIIYGGTLQNSYSITLFDLGNSGALTDIGGLVGSTGGTIEVVSSYWDTEVSELATSAGGDGVAGKTTSQMKTQSTYTGWDFTNIWGIQSAYNDGYPSFHPVPAQPTSNENHDTSSSSGPPGCSDLPPLSIPDAFQTNTIDTKTAIFFVPLTSRVNRYAVVFGTKPDSFEHAAFFDHFPDGVNKGIINDLAPNTTYYYKIQAQNGCTAGDWSGVNQITTTKNNKTVQVKYKDGTIKFFRKR